MFQPVIKWSGSKRSQASTLLSYFPEDIKCYYEPFIGGGAMLYAVSPSSAVCGDICEPLIALWNKVKSSPDTLAEEYRVRKDYRISFKVINQDFLFKYKND